MKWNIGCRALGRYRTPKGASRDRQLRIAAALKSQKLAEGLVKRSKLSLNHLGSEKAIPELAIPLPSLGESFPAGHDAAATSLSPGNASRKILPVMKSTCGPVDDFVKDVTEMIGWVLLQIANHLNSYNRQLEEV